MSDRKIRRNFVSQWYHVKQWQKFSRKEKMASNKIFRHLLHAADLSMFVLLIIMRFFSFNMKLHSRQRLVQSSAFSKTYSWKLILLNWTRNRMITYTYANPCTSNLITKKKPHCLLSAPCTSLNTQNVNCSQLLLSIELLIFPIHWLPF